MKTPEQVKGAIRNISKETGVNPNSLLQMYLFEGVLEKLSKSDYKDKIIIKGGLLVSSFLGVDMRSTMDMDATIKGIAVNEETILSIINEILNIPIESEIKYHLDRLTPIREQDVYEDFSAKIICTFGRIVATLNIDITTGDIITPGAVRYSYSRLFGGDDISIMSFTIETVLAEKFETISSRNVFTTRARDFYDLYMLYTTYEKEIDEYTLRDAILKTSGRRRSIDAVTDYMNISKLLLNNDEMKRLRDRYVKSNVYAKDIEFSDTVLVYKEIGDVTKLSCTSSF